MAQTHKTKLTLVGALLALVMIGLIACSKKNKDVGELVKRLAITLMKRVTSYIIFARLAFNLSK